MKKLNIDYNQQNTNKFKNKKEKFQNKQSEI